MASTGLGTVDDTNAWLPCPVCKEMVRCTAHIVLRLQDGPHPRGEIPIVARTTIDTTRLWRHFYEYHGPPDPFSEDETQHLIDNPELGDC